MGKQEWVPTRWYRVLMKDGDLWCETSSLVEAHESLVTLREDTGYQGHVERQYVAKQYKWVKQG